MPKLDAALVIEARRVARLQHKQRTLRKELRIVAAELKVARKNLRALACSTADPFEQSPPMRIFGEKWGTK